MPPPDPALVAEALALVQAQAQARQQIVDLTQAQVRAEVRAFTGWYDSARITPWAARLAKLTRSAQKQTATSTDSFSARVLRLLTGRGSAVGPVPIDDLWGGVPLESVYGRLADQYRWETATRGPSAPAALRTSDGGRVLPVLSPDDVLARVETRAEVQSGTALTLAFREQWVSDLARSGVTTGYRRIIHPELGGTVCGLCVAASTQIYEPSALLPIHGRCRCTVMPVIGDPLGPGDPGAAINDEDLAGLYEAAGGSTVGDNLKATKYKLVDHGELGPQLVLASQVRTVEQAKAAAEKAAARRSRQRIA